MNSVLGVSVGSSAVHVVGPYSLERDLSVRRVPVGPDENAERAAARTVAQLDSDSVTALAFRDERQAADITAAMAEFECRGFALLPEAEAAVHAVRTRGDLRDARTVLVYDLGHSGLTVSVVDVDSGTILTAERTSDVSGALIDRIIADDQMRQGAPADADFADRCREAKEQLSFERTVCVAGDGGVILLARDAFDALIDIPVAMSVQFADDVARGCGHPVDTVLLIGGGSNVPLVRTAVADWFRAADVIAPDDGDTLSAQGAALLSTTLLSDEIDAVTSVGAGVAPPAGIDTFRPEPAAPATSDPAAAASAATSSRWGRRTLLTGAAAVLVALGATAVVVAQLGGSGDAGAVPTVEVTRAPSVTAVPTTSVMIPLVPITQTPDPTIESGDVEDVPAPQSAAVPTATTTQPSVPVAPPVELVPVEPAPVELSTVEPLNEPLIIPGLPPIQLPQDFPLPIP